jgi:hypothetical protein
VHNDRVTRRTGTTFAAALVAAALVLSACSGGSGSSAPAAGGTGGSDSPGGSSAPGGTTDTPGQSGSPSASSGQTGVVQGNRLTFEGSKLKLGDTATVSWQPDQNTTGVIKVAVTKLQQVPLSTFSDFRLTGAVRKSTPYFVHATVRNVGKSDLSGVRVPLYLLDNRNTLLRTSTFQALFPACPSRPLPAKFTRGKKVSVCLVYFVPKHGTLVAISFRPTQDFDAITWTGTIAQPPKKKHKKKN